MELSGNDQSYDDQETRTTDPEGKKPPDADQKLSKITYNAMENINVIGQGLKQLFQHQRRRSSVSPHDVQQAQSEPEPDLEEQSPVIVTDADGCAQNCAQPTPLNRVLLQIRAPPKVKRTSAASLHNRRGKSDTQKGSPQINRKYSQDVVSLLQATASGRPRSSSTTDAPSSLSVLEISNASYLSGDETNERIERLEGTSLAQTAGLIASSTDGSINADGVDGALDPQRTKAAITHLQQKILRLTEQIKIEQTARDDNVAEYLKLANNADRQQGARIKQVFEKKNQKSAQTILQLQKKLEHYHRRLREAEHNGIPRQTKDVLRDMQQGLKGVGAKVTGFSEGVVDSVRGGLSSFSHATHTAAGAVVSKPREIASLIRNKFGSADNISNLDESQIEEGGKALGILSTLQPSPKYGSEDDCSSATSGSMGANSAAEAPCGAGSSKTNTLDMQSSAFDVLLHEIQEIRETQVRLEESLEDLKSLYQTDYRLIMQTLQEERYRCERLEEQLNDLTELHQNEILNLKQELASMEEKIAYQSYERARDIQEALEACQTRISKMELQQQQQQVVQLEGLENATARNLLGKFINILLAVMAVLLVFVSTVANCVVPLVKTRNRTCSSLFVVVFIAFLWKHWDAAANYLERFLTPPR